MTDVERRVIDAIDDSALIDCLSELIAFRSEGGNETPVQEHVARRMTELGMSVDRWDLDLPGLRTHSAWSAEIDREHALGVVGRFGRGAGRTLVLNGHVDVVPAGDPERWTVPPWSATTRDGRIYGRGAADMKGGLCCALFAVHAIRRAGIELPGTVLIQSVVGEEDGGCGTLAAIQRGHTGDAAIVLEPTEMMVAPAQAGALNFRLTVPGRAAHGALRTEGVSPLDHFLPLYAAMREFEARRNRNVSDPLFADYDIPFALCIGTIRSGIWASTEAESLTCEGRLGIAPSEEPDMARRVFERVIETAAAADPWLREHPPALQWWGGQFEPAAIATDHPIVTALTAAHQDATGAAPIVRGMPYGADMRLLVRHGNTPSVLYGPGDVRRAHAPDEFVPAADLEAVTRTLALCILRFCR
ncbi:ArgE/DapE family deacylase [soil metagenome]